LAHNHQGEGNSKKKEGKAKRKQNSTASNTEFLDKKTEMEDSVTSNDPNHGINPIQRNELMNSVNSPTREMVTYNTREENNGTLLKKTLFIETAKEEMDPTWKNVSNHQYMKGLRKVKEMTESSKEHPGREASQLTDVDYTFVSIRRLKSDSMMKINWENCIPPIKQKKGKNNLERRR
jgi:hypothetical protein